MVHDKNIIYYGISVSNSSVGWTMKMWKKCTELNARWGPVVLGFSYPDNFEKGVLDSSLSSPSSKMLDFISQASIMLGSLTKRITSTTIKHKRQWTQFFL